MEYILSHMVWLWVAVMALATFIEAATPVLVSIWFALGALASLLAAGLGASPTVQLALFVFVSIAALILARPLAKKFLDPHLVPTNADRVIGRSGRVTEKIVNNYSQGAVYVDGKTWTARSVDDSPIPAGEQVTVLRIEGVKLIVKKAEIPAETR